MLAISACAILTVGSPGLARAQAGQDAGSVWMAGGIARRPGASVAAGAQPILLFGLAGDGRATQRIEIPSAVAGTIEAGVNWFPLTFIGVEIAVARDRRNDTAPGSPYRVALAYQAQLPPDYVPRQYRYERDTGWPDVNVSIRRWTLNVNGALRWTSASRVSGTISGGASWVRVTGEADPLGFTTFVLGGHSVLFPNEYRLKVGFAPEAAWRYNIGGTLDTRVARHLAVTIAGRYTGGDDLDLTLRTKAVDGSQAGFPPPPNAEIDGALARSTVRVPASSMRLVGGLKLLF